MLFDGVIVLAARHGWPPYQLDSKNAFLDDDCIFRRKFIWSCPYDFLPEHVYYLHSDNKILYAWFKIFNLLSFLFLLFKVCMIILCLIMSLPMAEQLSLSMLMM